MPGGTQIKLLYLALLADYSYVMVSISTNELNPIPWWVTDELKESVLNGSFVCQASTADIVDMSNSTDVTTTVYDAARTTAFVENTKVVKGDFSGKGASDTLEQKFSSIKDFLAKPYLLNSVLWATTDAYNADIWSTTLGPLLNSNAAWANKLLGFSLVKGTFHVRMEITANRFQQGMTVLHYIPCSSTDQDNMHRATMNGVLQLPHVLANASDSSVELTIPYITPATHYNLKYGTFDWGKVWLRVLSPLKTGAAGETSARINFYVWIEDVELSAPVVPQVDTEAKPGLISDGLLGVSKVARAVATIPILSRTANTVGWAARSAASLASAFGWSKPTTAVQPMVVTRSNWRYNAVSDGADNSLPFGLVHDNKLNVRPFSIRPEDEMSLKFLLSVPNYVGRLTWSTGDATGTSYLSQALSPYKLGIAGSTTHNAHTASWFQGAPIFALSTFFQQWRGSLKLRLKIVKTEMHKGRLQITWTPGTSDPAAVTPTTASSIYSLRHIVDIAQKDTIELVLPYMVYTAWLNTAARTTSYDGGASCSGQLDIVVLNELRCPETCSSTVDILYWIEAGDDFEFSAPGGSLTSSVPFIPQASTEDFTDMLVSDGIGGSIVQSPTISPTLECIGEKFESIKQLLNRLSQVFLTSANPSAGTNLQIYPWFDGWYSIDAVSGALVTPFLTGDVLTMVSTWYAFQRGGLRISLSPNCNVAPGSIGVTFSPGQYGTATNVIFDSASSVNYGRTTAFSPGATANVYLGASTTETDYGQGMVSAKVPYHSRTPISRVGLATGRIPITPDVPIGVVNFINKSTSNYLSNVVLYRSCLDDFQLTYFLGCPPIIYGYA